MSWEQIAGTRINIVVVFSSHCEERMCIAGHPGYHLRIHAPASC